MADYLNPFNEVQKHGIDLPHWQQGEAIQFVTFRLGDALPAEKIRHYQQQRLIWLQNHPSPLSTAAENEYHRKFTLRLERWLDQGSGSCLLRSPSNRLILETSLMRFQGTRVQHHAWVIMPNHLHLLFSPLAPLPHLIRAWKSKSANEIGRGPIWQRNYRDTLIRDGDHFANAVRYIRRNPLKAKLREDEFTLWQSERALRI